MTRKNSLKFYHTVLNQKRTHAYGPMTQQKLLHARKDAPRE